MKTALILFATALSLAGSTAIAQSIDIAGTQWATANVAEPGKFAAEAHEAGGWFDFDRAQTACPQGWRLPGNDDLDRLRAAGSEWTTRQGVAGRLFPGGLFIPAVGRRNPQGAMEMEGESGYVWSNILLRNGYFGYCFYVDAAGAYNYEYECEYAMSVRCVKE